jgi:hypothetical protein
MVTAFQYALLLLLVMVVLQIVALSYYKTIILVAITSISYTLTIGMMAMLATRFFSWYSLNKNSIVLLYGVSAVILAINAGFTLFFVSDRLVATFFLQIYSPVHLARLLHQIHRGSKWPTTVILFLL